MFKEDQKDYVLWVYDSIAAVKSIPAAITFYCDEEHIVWRSDLRAWADTKYTYQDASGTTRHLTYNMRNYDYSAKPGQQGGGTSYATLGMYIPFFFHTLYSPLWEPFMGGKWTINMASGYHVALSDGSWASCLGQAHIFISNYRINPPPGTADTRRFSRIVRDGLNPSFNSLDSIHPLAQTIFHEVSFTIS